MTAFLYKALDARGQFVTGELQAASSSAAVQQLVDLGYVPLETSAGGSTGRSLWTAMLSQQTVSQREVTVLLQDLALLLRSGLPLDEGLQLLIENVGGATARLIAQLRAAIGSGANFAEALQSHPATARPELIAVARSGEATGRLDSALETIAGERVKQERINAQIRAALRYPAFLLCVAAGVMLFFLTVVVPQFAEVVRDFGTQGLLIGSIIGASAALREHGDVFAGAAAALVLLGVLAWRVPRARRVLVAPLLHLPVISGIIVLRRTAQFCRTLGILLSSGVNLADALRLMNESAIGGEQLAAVSDRVRRGERLVDALMEAKLIPPLAARMLRVGEESGALATVSLRCAGYYEAKLTEQVDRLTGIVGPAAIIIISIVIGTLVVSVMETLLSVNQMVV